MSAAPKRIVLLKQRVDRSLQLLLEGGLDSDTGQAGGLLHYELRPYVHDDDAEHERHKGVDVLRLHHIADGVLVDLCEEGDGDDEGRAEAVVALVARESHEHRGARLRDCIPCAELPQQKLVQRAAAKKLVGEQHVLPLGEWIHDLRHAVDGVLDDDAGVCPIQSHPQRVDLKANTQLSINR